MYVYKLKLYFSVYCYMGLQVTLNAHTYSYFKNVMFCFFIFYIREVSTLGLILFAP